MRTTSAKGRERAGKTRKVQAAALLLAGLWPGVAAAYRPFDGTDAAVAKQGEAEIEFGLGHLTEGGTRSLIAPQLVLNRGLSSRWELVFDGAGVFPLDWEPGSPRFRFEDTGLFLKGVLREGNLQSGSGPSIATEVGAILPTLHGEPGVGASAAMIVSQQWDALTVHTIGLAERTRAKNLGWFGGLIVEGPNRWILRPVGEVFVEGESGGNPRTASGLAGTIWRVRDAFSLDLAFRGAHIGNLAVYEARLGFTWDIGLWRNG
jgi:hypothetical protein